MDVIKTAKELNEYVDKDQEFKNSLEVRMAAPET